MAMVPLPKTKIRLRLNISSIIIAEEQESMDIHTSLYRLRTSVKVQALLPMPYDMGIHVTYLNLNIVLINCKVS